ncbi:Alpha/Beta hydrolase protein [Hyaloraphidium curvatum]|nr:Alpha/Beta hydrolase protein [Hyaloraphidium curvatum]
MDALESTESFVHDGLTLHYAVLGPADGPLVVFLHGLSGSRHSWLDVAAPLAEKGFRCVLFDMRGHGKSGRAPEKYTTARFAADAAALLDHLGGRAVVAGHSLGAVTAYLAACLRPDAVTQVLLEDPPFWLAEDFAGSGYKAMFEKLREDTVRMQAAKAAPAEITAEIAAMPVAPGSTVKMGDILTAADLAATGHSRAAMDPLLWTQSIEGKMADHGALPSSSVGGVLLRAQGDLGAAFFPSHVERFAPLAPKVEVVEVKGAGHNIHGSKAHRQAVVDALDRILTAAA